MHSLKRKVTLVAAAVLAVVLVVVPGALPTRAGPAVKNPATLVVMTIGGPESLDPAWAYDTASSGVFLWNIYETLIFFEGGRTDLYVPMLATQVPTLQNGGISRDSKTYTFRIRQGVRFHDGSTMTAEDVKYSLMRFMLIDRDGGPSWILLSAILGPAVHGTREDDGDLIGDIYDRVNRAIQVSGNTVRIMLAQPYAPFLNITASWSMIVSKRFVTQNGGWNGTKATLAKFNNPEKAENTSLFSRASGTGPFRLERWDRATETVRLVRNDNYWRARANLQRVVIRKVEEFGPRRLALQNGDADIIAVSRQDQPAVTGIQGVRLVDDLPELGNSPALFMNLNINTQGNPDVGSGRLDGNGIPANFFSDVHVRRGFAHLFDRQRFINEALRGKGRVANGPVPFGMLGHAARGQWYEVSRDKASAEFREAHGGQVWERGFKFTILFNSGNVSRQTAAQMVKEAAQALNPKFQIDVRGVTWSNYLGLMRERKLPMFLVGWAADFADPDNFAFPFMHSEGTFAQRQSYKSADADRLIQQAAAATDPQRRTQLYAQLQEIAFRDVPTIYIVYPVGFVVMRNWVKGWYHNPIFFSTWNYAYRLSKG